MRFSRITSYNVCYTKLLRIPEAHLLGRLVDRLPAAFKTVYGEQTLWQWIAMLVCVLLAIAAGMLVFRLFRALEKRFPRNRITSYNVCYTKLLRHVKICIKNMVYIFMCKKALLVRVRLECNE